jgi:hypothetical protein
LSGKDAAAVPSTDAAPTKKPSQQQPKDKAEKQSKPKADAAIATESTPQLNLQPLLAIKENDVDTTQLEIEQVDAQPEPTAETIPNTEPTQIAEQEQQPAAQEQQSAAQVAQSTPVEPEPPMLENTSGSELSIQAQLAAQQTIAQLEAYALQKQAEQEAKDLLEQQLLQTLQEQVQQQQALAETKRLQEEQRLWVQAAEEASRIMAEQKQILEAELQRQQALLQAEAEFKAKVMAEQAALEQLAREQQAMLAEQAEQARLAAIEALREELRQSFAKAELAERARIAEAAQALNAKQQAWADQIQSERLSNEQARLAAKEAQEAAEAKRMAELKQQADEMRQALAARQQQEKQIQDQMKKVEVELTLASMSEQERAAYEKNISALGAYGAKFQDVMTIVATGGARNAEDNMKMVQLGPTFVGLIHEMDAIKGNEQKDVDRRRERCGKVVELRSLIALNNVAAELRCWWGGGGGRALDRASWAHT